MTISGFGYKPTSPKTILGSSLLQWCRSDHGCAPGQWDDLSGNGYHYVQAVSGSQPVYGSTSGPNGTPALTFDGVDDCQIAPLGRPSPAITPTWVWIVLKVITWSNTKRIISADNSSSMFALIHTPSSPGIAGYNGTTGPTNNDLAVGSWGALQAGFSNSTSDYIQINDNSPVTGVSLGNQFNATGMNIGSGNGALFSNMAISEIAYASAFPSVGQLARLSAYRMSRYGF